MKMWITKYALSSGIREAEVKFGFNDGWVRESGEMYWHMAYKKGRDAFESKSAAIADAEKRRNKKIASLKKQIEKLEKLVFE